MKYRVVQLRDGSYQAQYRVLFLFWMDSCHAPSHDRQEQIAFASHAPRPRIQAVVWP